MACGQVARPVVMEGIFHNSCGGCHHTHRNCMVQAWALWAVRRRRLDHL
jgi:hypothetical protein